MWIIIIIIIIIVIIIIIIIIITNTKKFFAQTTTQKKIVCLEKIFIPPPPKKIMVSPLRCLNTVCARSTICTADVNKCARTRLWEKQTWRLLAPVQRSIHFVQWRLCKCFFRLNNQTVCYVSKTFVFQCIKGNTLGKYPAFLGLFVWIENPVKCSACAVNQKIVTARFSGNALIFTKLLVKISWNLVEL